jgi:7-keto-8-aminopelargonate synthetase-like enzyme
LLRELLPMNAMSTKGGSASSAIFPWIVGDEQAALDLASALQHEGFLVPAIRYPTVAKGSARLRITVTASHEENQIRSLCEAIKRRTAKL